MRKFPLLWQNVCLAWKHLSADNDATGLDVGSNVDCFWHFCSTFTHFQQLCQHSLQTVRFIRQPCFRPVTSQTAAPPRKRRYGATTRSVNLSDGRLRLLWQRKKLSPQPMCAIVVATSKDDVPASDSHSADRRRRVFRVERAVNLLNDSSQRVAADSLAAAQSARP